ncbi:hypothetical protein AG4045_005769 [Apium graveolens]|uniref:photosystem I n=1 Tax=Apium graveolens TaxID=4045 RepID=A0A6L5B751_APIGR|nr:hypothetical protein AG4045_005769 [Apium graveolens]
MYFHGARFSNYEAWLSDPTHIGPSAQVVWPIVGQEILNGDVGGGFRGIQITSGFFQLWRASGITSELQLYCTAIGALIFAALMLFAVGAAAHAAIFMVRDYDPTTRYNDLLDRVLRHRDAIISHLNWALGGKVALLPIPLGTADFLVHHIHAFTIHVTVLILLKGVLFARSSRLIPDKANLGFRFPCDGPGRGGTCQVSAWDHVFLGLFWMYNAISVVIFHFSWKMQSDVWGSISDQGVVTHITGGNFAQSSITINGWLRDFLWAQASQVIQSYGSSLSAYGLFFLGAHFVWAFSLMFLFSGRGYWQELIESIVWAHNKLKVAPATQPRALSIVQGRAVGVTHYLLGGIATTWAFFLARIIAVG